MREAASIEEEGKLYFSQRVAFLVDHIFVITEGGPNNASSLLQFYIYEVAFDYWDTAYAATLTVLMLAILTTVAIGQFFFLDKKVHYK